jgi:hypothetical protein
LVMAVVRGRVSAAAPGARLTPVKPRTAATLIRVMTRLRARPMSRTALALAWLACAGTAAQAAGNCDQIKAQIDAKVRAGGVAQFSLSVVDADAHAAGKVVGSCDRGTRKIVYVAGAGATAAAAPAAPASKPAGAKRRADEPILTECKDGSVSLGGDCRKAPR